MWLGSGQIIRNRYNRQMTRLDSLRTQLTCCQYSASNIAKLLAKLTSHFDSDRTPTLPTIQLSRNSRKATCPMFAPKIVSRRVLCTPPRALFHSTARRGVKANDPVPDLEVLVEGSPGNGVNLAKELRGKGIIIGVPAAFSPSCSNSHIPGYLSHPKLPQAGSVFVVSVNDPFVMKAWGTSLVQNESTNVRFLGDPSGEFTKALDLLYDGSAIFGGSRSKRYALLVEDGKVRQAFVEPDNTGVNGKLSILQSHSLLTTTVSAAENVLGQ